MGLSVGQRDLSLNAEESVRGGNDVVCSRGTSSLNDPSGFALTDATKVSPRSYNRTVTTFEAITCPVTAAPELVVAVGCGNGVNVWLGIAEAVGVGEPAGIDVNVGVGDPAGMDVIVGVAVGAATFGPITFCTEPLE